LARRNVALRSAWREIAALAPALGGNRPTARSAVAIAADSDLIGTIPTTLLGLAGTRLEAEKVCENMATNHNFPFVKRESPLTLSAVRFTKLIKEEGRRFSQARGDARLARHAG